MVLSVEVFEARCFPPWVRPPGQPVKVWTARDGGQIGLYRLRRPSLWFSSISEMKKYYRVPERRRRYVDPDENGIRDTVEEEAA